MKLIINKRIFMFRVFFLFSYVVSLFGFRVFGVLWGELVLGPREARVVFGIFAILHASATNQLARGGRAVLRRSPFLPRSSIRLSLR